MVNGGLWTQAASFDYSEYDVSTCAETTRFVAVIRAAICNH